MAQTPPEGPGEPRGPSEVPGREPAPGQQRYGQWPQGQPAHGEPAYRPAYGQPPAGEQRKNTWLIPAIIGLAIVLVVGAVVFMLTRGSGDAPTADPGAPGASAPASEPATDPTVDGATAETADGADPFVDATADSREVSPDPLQPRVDREILGTDFVLSDAGWSEHAAGMEAGAREAVAGTYTNGSVDVPVTAAAFDTIAGQDAFSEQLATELKDDGARLLSDGTVYPDSTGHHWAFLLADGVTTTVVWRTDDGVVLTLTGDPEAVPEIYSSMLI